MNERQLFYFPFYLVTIFLAILVVTVVIFSSLTLNLNHTTIAQQRQQQQQQSLPFVEDVSFDIDNVTFSHHMASVNGIQLHYVIGGQGEPVVLLHGWPETWYAWHHIMPALAKNYTVVAPDLRGLGDSSKPLTGYDGKTLAEDIHQLVTQLGFKTIFLVGHDIGTVVAYPYAAEHPSEVKRLVVIESPIPGFFPPGIPPAWHIIFHQTPGMYQKPLVEGKEMMYLSWFYNNEAYNSAAITQADINEYVSHYSAPGGMRAGFEYLSGCFTGCNSKSKLFKD